MRAVKLPRSSKPTQYGGAKLIRCIVQGRYYGAFRIDGAFLKPGSVIAESDLWPGPDWPAVPHLLEMFPSSQSKGGHGGSKIDVVLWRYENGEWRQICRMNGHDSSAWLAQLEPVLNRSLGETRAPVVEPPDMSAMSAIADQLAAPIAARFATLETHEQREAFATELFTRLMFLICEAQDGTATAPKKPAASERASGGASEALKL